MHNGHKSAPEVVDGSDRNMNKRQIIIALATALLPCILMAADSTTNALLAKVAATLRPALAKLNPAPVIEYPEYYPSSLQVTYLPQTYKIHGRSMDGRVSTNAVDQIGPGFKGFVLNVHLQPKGEVNQACTPQTLREPYWLTELDVAPIDNTDKQIYWALSYAGRPPTTALAEIRAALKGLGKGTTTGQPPPPAINKTSEPDSTPLIFLVDGLARTNKVSIRSIGADFNTRSHGVHAVSRDVMVWGKFSAIAGFLKALSESPGVEIETATLRTENDECTGKIRIRFEFKKE